MSAPVANLLALAASLAALAVMVQGVLDLSATLGVDVVAEGIEREDQCRLLTAMGCAWGQGWLFDRALPAEDLERRHLRARTPSVP